jgi:uncharacterized protein YecT (DUF1311 family)
VACAVFIFVSAAEAETSTEWYGPEYRQCGDADTATIVQCVSKLVKLWEARLDAAFKKLLELTEADRREELQKTQNLWMQYRDANCGWYGSGAGTIKRIEASECMRIMTSRRALDLEIAGETH